jgi:hypothetical protein
MEKNVLRTIKLWAETIGVKNLRVFTLNLKYRRIFIFLWNMLKIRKSKCIIMSLTLNNVAIESREDGFINATQLCKAGGKKT